MSGSHPGQAGAAAEGADPSMEDILASIRRILSEDEAEAAAAPQAAGLAPSSARTAPAATQASAAAAFQAPAARHDDVLDLDAAMIVEDAQMPTPMDAEPVQDLTVQNSAAEPAVAPPVPSPAFTMAAPADGAAPAAPRAVPGPLVAPEAAAATAASVGTLLRTLAAGREQIPVHRGGPTLEDMVREEIRPLLKDWLDANLPPLVERVVRAEMERVVGRVA